MVDRIQHNGGPACHVSVNARQDLEISRNQLTSDLYHPGFVFLAIKPACQGKGQLDNLAVWRWNFLGWAGQAFELEGRRVKLLDSSLEIGPVRLVGLDHHF